MGSNGETALRLKGVSGDRGDVWTFNPSMSATLTPIAVGTPVTRRPPRTDPCGRVNAHGSCLRSNVSRTLGNLPSRTPAWPSSRLCHANPAQRPVRALAALTSPLAPVLRSIDSAGTLIPLFADFTATMTESDSSSPFVSGYDSSVFPSRPRH